MKSFVLSLARPLLLMHFTAYVRDVRRAPFPVDAPESRIAGPTPDRVLFIGDVALAGYGVLHHGMSTAFRTAKLISRRRGRGCRWETIAAADLTAARVARMETFHVAGVDTVVIMLGIPDVLLATRATRWATSLRTVAARIRAEAGLQSTIVFVAIPAMEEFRPIPDPARRLLVLQTQRLNRAMRTIASETANAVYVPFPKWELGDRYAPQIFSWKAMHKKLAQAIAPVILEHLHEDARDLLPSG